MSIPSTGIDFSSDILFRYEIYMISQDRFVTTERNRLLHLHEVNGTRYGEFVCLLQTICPCITLYTT